MDHNDIFSLLWVDKKWSKKFWKNFPFLTKKPQNLEKSKIIRGSTEMEKWRFCGPRRAKSMCSIFQTQYSLSSGRPWLHIVHHQMISQQVNHGHRRPSKSAFLNFQKKLKKLQKNLKCEIQHASTQIRPFLAHVKQNKKFWFFHQNFSKIFLIFFVDPK